MDSLSLAPSKAARNLGVIIDDQLTFTDHIASISRLCCFALFNIRKIRPYLTPYATQLLVQTLVISCLDYCPHHVTPLRIELHWLPVPARIKFKSRMLAYRVIVGSASTYLNALVSANVTPRMLRSSNERRLALPSVQVRQSRLFSFVVPRWWNELPSTTRAGASLSTFKKLLKTQLFREHLPS